MKFYWITLFFVFASYLFSPFFYALSCVRKFILRKRTLLGNYDVLIFQTPRIGDMVCVTPVFREIKKAYPTSKITVLGEKNALGILCGNLHIDRIIAYNPFGFFSFFYAWLVLIKSSFTHSVNFFPSLSPNILPFWLGVPERICTKTESPKLSIKFLSLFVNKTKLYKKGDYAPCHHLKLLEFLNIKNPDPKREIFSTGDSVEKAQKYFSGLNLSATEKLIGISLNCDKKFREWPKEKFIRLIKMIWAKSDAIVFLIGGENNRNDVEEVISKIGSGNKIFNAVGLFKISEIGVFLKRLDLFISIDTGPLYIADAVGVPTIDIIGPSDPKTQSPVGKTIIVKSRHNAKPCSYIMYKSDCGAKQLEKLMDISPEEVFKAYENIIS